MKKTSGSQSEAKPSAKRRAILLVDDHPAVREGVAVAINQTDDLTVCGHAASASTAMAEIARLKPNAVLADISLENSNGLELIVKDRYENFAGAILWLIDKDGVGKISYDYTYTGDDLDTREIGLKAMLPAKHDEINWRRWSEWGVFPKDCICRTEGTATAHRNKKSSKQPANVKPNWPWSQDENELGSADFRSIKFCIYNASLMASNGSGVRVDAIGDAHFRACLAAQGVEMHVLSQCPLAPMILKNGDRLAGTFCIRLLA